MHYKHATTFDIDFRVTKQNLLTEIGTILQMTSQEVNAKMHSLRTQFNREISRQKLQKSGSSSDESYVSKWEYMSSLQFLKIEALNSNTTSNLVRSIQLHFGIYIAYLNRLVHLFESLIFIQDTASVKSDDSSNSTDTNQTHFTESGSTSSIAISSESDVQSEDSGPKRKKSFQQNKNT